jgi:hypothetical protein
MTTRCPNCRRRFTATAGRQRYCDRFCQQAGRAKGLRAFDAPRFLPAGSIPNAGEWAVVVEMPVDYDDEPLPWLHGQYATEAAGRAAAEELAGRGVRGVRLEHWQSTARSGDRLGETVAAVF